jgi:hypothetical protein
MERISCFTPFPTHKFGTFTGAARLHRRRQRVKPHLRRGELIDAAFARVWTEKWSKRQKKTNGRASDKEVTTTKITQEAVMEIYRLNDKK